MPCFYFQDFPEFVTLLPGFFIPLIACMFRISTNQELNDRRIMPAMFIQPWPQTDPSTADVSTTCAEGVTPTWAEGTTPTWAEGTIPTWAEGTNPTWATKPTWAGETTHTWVHPPPQ